MKRVVVTGLGLITALGTGLEKSWKKILAGETGVGLIESYDTTDMPVKIAAEVKDFDPLEFGIEKKKLKNWQETLNLLSLQLKWHWQILVLL